MNAKRAVYGYANESRRISDVAGECEKLGIILLAALVLILLLG